METPVPQGGAESALDMSNPRDRALLRKSIADWPKRFRAITPEKRDNWVNDLEDARATAKNIADGDKPAELKLAAVQTVQQCIKTSALLDAMQQKDEHAQEAGKLKDQHHLEALAQADRHHAEKIAADAKNPKADGSMRILIVDARTGAERSVSGFREFYQQYPATPAPLALPDRDVAGSEPAEGGQGGPPRGQNGLGSR